jgi:hypothetical protein
VKTHLIYRSALFTLAVILSTLVTVAAQDMHITATAMGTSTQLGRIVNIDVRVNEYSTPEDQKILFDAFRRRGSQGLANSVEKMSSKGRIAITGTIGYDLNYIREFKMADGGRKIRFVTDRPISFRESWYGTRSRDYQLCMGEIILGPNGKYSGTLMPAAMLRLKSGEVEIEAYQNPWRLTNIHIYD